MGFERLLPRDIDPMAVVAQSLDNQWVPAALLRRMLARGMELSEVRDELRAQVRAEYIRALINSPQVVINRAFLYNNPIVFEGFREGSPDREAFLSLLNSGAIVQMLVAERSSADTPAFLEDQRTPNYTTLKQGWQAWIAAAAESRVRSLRFSWDDDRANAEQIRVRLADAFTRRAQTLVNLYGPALAQDLGIDLDSALAIKRRLVEVSTRCAEYSARDEFATRERLYAEFITAEGSDPALGRYDRSRPFCEQVKQLIDLAYNINLATGLEALALTPSEALHRTTLQEWEAVERRKDPISPEQLAQLLRGGAFDFVQEKLFLDTFATLSLRDVRDVRLSAAWRDYVDRMGQLLAAPLEMFADPRSGAPAVVAAYLDLLEETTRIATSRRGGRVPTRKPRDFGVVVSVEVAGAMLEYSVGPAGPVVVLAGAVAAPFLTEAARVTVSLGVRAYGSRRSRSRALAALDARTQVLSGWVDSGGRFWADLVRDMRGIKGIDDAARLLRSAKGSALDGDFDTGIGSALD